ACRGPCDDGARKVVGAMRFVAVAGVFMLVGMGFYLIPTIVALVRKPVTMTAAIIVNILLGWTMIGWVVALVLAMGSKHRLEPYPVHTHRVYAPPPTQPLPAWGTPEPFTHTAAPTVTDAPVTSELR